MPIPASAMPIDITKFQSNARQASTLLKAMSNDRRLLILCHLVGGEKTVGELEALVGLSQSALSQHLARLRRDGLVRTRRQRQAIYYALQGGEARAVMATLHDLYCGTEAPVKTEAPAETGTGTGTGEDAGEDE